MIYEIAKNLENWDDFAAKKGYSFLQSFSWGKVEDAQGKTVIWILEKNEKGEIIEQFQLFFVKLIGPFGFWYMPYVSVLPSDILLFKKTLQNIKKGIFFRIEYLGKEQIPKDSIKTWYRQPAQTIVLDLKQGEEKILTGMHTKTRYNIRVSEKKNVVIDEQKNADVFWKLNEETASRDNFKSHDKKHYENILKNENVEQFTAYFEHEAIASIITINFSGTTTYLHGASSYKARNLMAPYLLQWRAIKKALEQNKELYDFWGVAPMEEINTSDSDAFNGFSWNKNHKWAGITRFKAGFGGEYKKYDKAFELPISLFPYKIYQIVRKLAGYKRV